MNAEDLRRALSATVIQAQNLNHSVINFGQLAQGMEAFKSALSGISSFLSSLSGDAEPFADAMQATNTMAGRDASGLEALKVEVTELAQRVPVAREALANGLYQVISNGVPEDNWISFLEASSRSAVGGIADLGQVVGVTSTIIKNYGLSWEQAVAIQDKIQLTAKNGVTSFEQLAASLPKVTANAATLGVSIDELMATFATLKGVSGNTAEVATQLAAVMTALVKPSSEAVKIAAQMGVQFDAAAVKAAGGFQQFLSSLDASVKAYAASSGVLEQEIYAKLFGSAEALRALIPLNGELASKFGSNVAEMKNSAGTMDAAFENMSKTGAAAAQSLKNYFVELFDFINEFGTSLKPFFEGIEVMSQLGASIKTVTEAVKTLNLFFIKTCTLKVGAFLTVISTQAGRAAIRTQGLGAAVRATTASTKGLTLALRALGGATAVGLLIWGVTEAVTLLTSRTREARKAVDELSASQKQSARTADELKSAEEAYSSSAAEGLGAINKEIASLKALIDA
ncbi:MAG: phage tail tape measure protein, partial [Muribaculaceae bacterium]|nr:phage tail tape measure protein [Muribaculaceae bacterium]